MTSRRAGPTIDRLLDDPMTRAVMQADHVDPTTIRSMLHSMAARLQTVPGAAVPARPALPRASVIFDRCTAAYWP
jgi:hypothetical protein